MSVTAFFRYIRDAISALAHLVVIYTPDEFGNNLRLRYYRDRFKSLGQGVRIDPGVLISGAEYVEIGDNVWLDPDVVIMAGPAEAGGEITRFGDAPAVDDGIVRIGDNVHVGTGSVICGVGYGVTIGRGCGLGKYAMISTLSHHHSSKKHPEDRSFGCHAGVPRDKQSLIAGAVSVGDNVGISSRATILPGVSIGKDGWIGTLAVVMPGTRFEENCFAVDNPAKRRSTRYRARNGSKSSPNSGDGM